MTPRFGLLTPSQVKEAERLCERLGIVLDEEWLDAGLEIRLHDTACLIDHVARLYPEGMRVTRGEIGLLTDYMSQRLATHKAQLVNAYVAAQRPRPALRVLNPERERAAQAGSSTEPDMDLIERMIIGLNLRQWRTTQQQRGGPPRPRAAHGEVEEPEVDAVLLACGLDPAEATWGPLALARSEVRIRGVRDVLDDPELWPPGVPSAQQRALLESVARAAESLAHYITFALLGEGEFGQLEHQQGQEAGGEH